jgi:hypothetical protein
MASPKSVLQPARAGVDRARQHYAFIARARGGVYGDEVAPGRTQDDKPNTWRDVIAATGG